MIHSTFAPLLLEAWQSSPLQLNWERLICASMWWSVLHCALCHSAGHNDCCNKQSARHKTFMQFELLPVRGGEENKYEIHDSNHLSRGFAHDRLGPDLEAIGLPSSYVQGLSHSTSETKVYA